MPNYNDWKSLQLLLEKINNQFKKDKMRIEVFIVNDCSSEEYSFKIKHLKKINSIKIINLKKNVGSQKAIFIGLNEISKINSKSTLVIMDSDGEDDPTKIKKLVNKAIQKKDYIIFARRKKRLESVSLRFLNQLRLLLTFFLSGKYINVGNFCAFHGKNLKKIISRDNLSIAFCSGAIKNHNKIDFIDIPKSKRFLGTSKVNSFFLIKHAINIVSVFYKIVFLRTFFFLLILLNVNLINLDFILLSLFLIINLLFFFSFNLASLKGNPKKFISDI